MFIVFSISKELSMVVRVDSLEMIQTHLYNQW